MHSTNEHGKCWSQRVGKPFNERIEHVVMLWRHKCLTYFAKLNEDERYWR